MLLNSWCRAARRCAFLLLGLGLAMVRIEAQPPVPAVAGLPEEMLPGLEPILKAAAQRSPEAIKRSLDVDAAEARRLYEASALYPSIYGSARYAVNDESVSGNSGTSNRSSGFFYNFALNQPVFYWGALKAQAEHGRIGVKIAGREYAEAMRLLLQQLRRSYLELVVQKSALRALRQELTLEEQAITRQQARLKEGVAVPGEVAMAELAVERRKLQIEMAQQTLDFSKQSLARLAGTEPLADDAIPNEFARPKPETATADALLRAFTQGGVFNSYRAQVFSLSIQQSEKDYIVAQHRLHPKFSVYAGYDVRSETQASASSLAQVAVADRNYGVKLDWSIFDGWATSGQKLAALSSKRSYERQLQTHIETTTDAARAMHQQLGFAARGLDLAERDLAGARALLQQVQDEHKAGRMTQGDVDRTQLSLMQAEARILPARAEYLNRWAEFVSLVGADPAMNHVPARYAR